MAYEIPGFTFTLEAAADLSAKQFYFVKIDSDGKAAAITADTDIPAGILQNAPTAGQAATIMHSGISKVSADAAIATPGTVVGPSADGQCVTRTLGSDTTKHAVGQVLVGAGTAGNLASILFNCGPNRSA